MWDVDALSSAVEKKNPRSALQRNVPETRSENKRRGKRPENMTVEWCVRKKQINLSFRNVRTLLLHNCGGANAAPIDKEYVQRYSVARRKGRKQRSEARMNSSKRAKAVAKRNAECESLEDPWCFGGAEYACGMLRGKKETRENYTLRQTVEGVGDTFINSSVKSLVGLLRSSDLLANRQKMYLSFHRHERSLIASS